MSGRMSVPHCTFFQGLGGQTKDFDRMCTPKKLPLGAEFLVFNDNEGEGKGLLENHWQEELAQGLLEELVVSVAMPADSRYEKHILV